MLKGYHYKRIFIIITLSMLTYDYLLQDAVAVYQKHVQKVELLAIAMQMIMYGGMTLDTSQKSSDYH